MDSIENRELRFFFLFFILRNLKMTSKMFAPDVRSSFGQMKR